MKVAKVELVFDEHERLLQLEVPYGFFTTCHSVRVDNNDLVLPPLPQPVKVKKVLLLVEEQEAVQN